MKVAVTGATGFLGRYIVSRLLADNYTVRAWYRDERKKQGFPAGIEWVKGELGNEASAAELLNGADFVVHAALQWPGRRSDASQNGLLEFAQANLMGSLLLMNMAHRAGIKRFVFISTCAVHDTVLPDRPLDETHPLWPHGHYGAHKAALEKFVHSFGLGKGWPICALRPTGIYGLAEPAPASKWFDLVGQVVRGEKIETAVGGKEVHAEDVASATSLLLKVDAEAIRGQAFNCYDIYIAEQRVAAIARDISGSKSEIANLNAGPKNQIDVSKLKSLGMNFGGDALLRRTIDGLVTLHRQTR